MPSLMGISKKHAGWSNRGYLPHYDKPGLAQAVTFRLADSLPQEKRREWEHLLQIAEDGERLRQIEAYLDRGAGSCVLREPACAEVVQNALLHFDGERYQLIAWCVMPNHVHVLFQSFNGHPIGRVIHSWKTFTAREINKLLGQSGQLWQDDYFDTFMRDDEHQAAVAVYIERNAVSANLVERANDWPWSSAMRNVKVS